MIHSAWRAADGSIGIVFLNISEQPQRITFRLQGHAYGFPRGAELAATILGLDEAEQPTREIYGTLAGGQGRITLDLEPRGMRALEVVQPKRTQHPGSGQNVLIWSESPADLRARREALARAIEMLESNAAGK